MKAGTLFLLIDLIISACLAADAALLAKVSGSGFFKKSNNPKIAP
jgi:hypothetical protein